MESRTSEVFTMTDKAWHETTRFVSSCGGTRSGKTYANLQLLYAWAMRHPNLLISVVSETLPHLKRGAIRDFQTILGETFDAVAWNKTDCIYELPNGSLIEFFSADSPAKVHGPARDILFINEAQNIPYEVARQLFVRTRDKILVDYNPTHSFWVNERIETQDNCKRVHSTYLNNRDAVTGKSFLTDAQLAEIEGNKNDPNWWRVYGEGKVGKLEGQIFDFEQIDELPDSEGLVETYGMDFGFTNDPTTLIHCLIDTDSKIIYADELLYQKGMLNADIAGAMTANGVNRNARVYADCAEPKTIEELYQYGFNVLPCYKATRKAEQLQILRGYQHRITKRSTNLIREHRGYVWATDKEGRPLNEPIAYNDHAEDALRYGCIGYLTERGGGFGIGFNRDYEVDYYPV